MPIPTIKKGINQAIHPPIDDASKILAAADRVYIELPIFPLDEERRPRCMNPVPHQNAAAHRAAAFPRLPLRTRGRRLCGET